MVGNVIPDLYHYEDHGIPSDKIVAAAKQVLQTCSLEQETLLRFPVNASEWRAWSNPEPYFSPFGLRLEEISDELSKAILSVIEATLSPEGYKKVINAMLINHFLGEVCNGSGVLNEKSYNFLLFGEPSTTKPWGWSIYGHHLCMAAFLDRQQVVISPVFIGAEPNEIDDGPYAGTTIMRPEEAKGLELMQSLPPEQQKVAQVYENLKDDKMPEGRWNVADQRHVFGAFQDNRIVPYEGLRLSLMSAAAQAKIFDILAQFYIYLPEKALQMRIEQAKSHVEKTWFSWIGAYGDDNAFYYRIHGPTVAVEFDHHSGVFLSNDTPERFHIHTVSRMPNGGDYGNALRKEEDRVL